MLVLLVGFGVLSAIAPVLVRRMGPKAFPVLALMPAAAFAYTLTQSSNVLSGNLPTEYVPWVPQLDLALSFRMDTLAWAMSLIVTGVGALVLLYCTYYFGKDEESLGRFAGILLLFSGVMFGLVTADDILVMFIFWEITSVLSYLLIGHYTGRKESRGAALQALLVTTLGGLAMLVGVIILSVVAGTTSLSAIVAAELSGPMITTAIFLVLAGAISKSALFPFHFWLPAAMAAPTPVSAYLHAAAMVKAGIYLIARLAPGYADTPGWIPFIVLFGCWTMLLGGWRSLRQYDLKLVLAYGTVSQLGFLTVMVGFGKPDVALAGIALVLAHALYKSTLFLVVGIIDHQTGTRDWRQLSGIGRRRRVLAVVTAVAIASMIGIPPTLGFVAKETALSSLIAEGAAGNGWAWTALVGIILGSIFTAAYSFRFFWGAFSTKKNAEETVLHAGKPGELAAPLVLAALSVTAGLTSHLLDGWFGPYVASMPGEQTSHLALWHGIEPALLISIGIILIGALMFRKRKAVSGLQLALHGQMDAAKVYWALIRAIDTFSAKLTIFMQRGGLPKYLMTIMVVFVVALGAASTLNRVWPSEIRLFDYPAQPVIGLVIIVAALATTAVSNRMTGVLLVGITGYGLVMLFAFHGAPDLALTQALVETITIVVFILVMRRLTPHVTQRDNPGSKRLRAMIGIAVGLVMSVIAVAALGARQAESISHKLPELALEAHGSNIVNVILVDIRAWDTMGEISVLVAVATGVASLIFVTGRNTSLPRLGGSREIRSRHNFGRTVLEPASRKATSGNTYKTQKKLREEDSSPSRRAWLLAGRTLSEKNRSILVEVLVRLMFHPAILVSIYLLFVGHNQPGGGFAGGLLASLALVSRYLAGGRYELGEAISVDAGKLLGIGVLLAAGTAVSSLFFGLSVLESTWFEYQVPLLGTISIGTSTIFDIGVYLVVIGLALDVLRSLGAEIDRQDEQGLESRPESEQEGAR